MSWWSYEKEPSGRIVYVTSDYSAIMPLFVVVCAIGTLQYLMSPTGTVRFLLWSGFSSVLMAKLRLFRRGIWSSWGPEKMTRGWATLYKVGYALIALGIFLIILAYRAAR
ncbi:MAG: hypothetical protein EXR70_22205 [Deltaproteobacteria bacterium]|nr:hypothetical protein [Deltaproteobacteria bacterium]